MFFFQLEVRLENAQDELNAVNGGVGSTPSLYSSMVHSDYYSETGVDLSAGIGPDESVSGRSSVRSTGGEGRERGRLDKIDWSKQARMISSFFLLLSKLNFVSTIPVPRL